MIPTSYLCRSSHSLSTVAGSYSHQMLVIVKPLIWKPWIGFTYLLPSSTSTLSSAGCSRRYTDEYSARPTLLDFIINPYNTLFVYIFPCKTILQPGFYTVIVHFVKSLNIPCTSHLRSSITDSVLFFPNPCIDLAKVFVQVSVMKRNKRVKYK